MKFFLGIFLLLRLSNAQEPALRGSAIDALSAPSLDHGEDLPYLLERQGRRQLAVGGMVPLSCNDSYRTCEPWSSFIGGNARHSNLVIIPCGRCVTMDYGGDTLTLDEGLDIRGKLVFPNGYSGLTLRSPMIVVQGELEMTATMRVGATPAIKFLMTGNFDRRFDPVGENAGYCGGSCIAGKKAITVAGGRVDILGLPGPAKTWVKLYDVVGSGQSVTGIVLPADGVLNRWGVGAEILITSHSQRSSDQQVARIARFDTDYPRAGFVRLFLDQSIDRPTTTLDDRDFAVEVALLSRNIVFEGGPDTTSGHGGHFWIFETNGYEQRVEGVEVVNFGQAGVLGRYPLHAHLCGDLSGSVMSRNSIRESNQRCVVVHASDNLLIEDNVAYDNAGHCFMLEDGMETGNEFVRNLGALTTRPIRIIPNMGLNGVETDSEPSTFWIPALGNSWVGNVAAGSTDNGFWFEPMLRGPLADLYPDLRPERINIISFEGNVAHSNGIGMKTYPQRGLRPDASQPNRFIDFKVYRNQFKGLFAFFAHNLIIQGGIFADSSVNLDIDNCLNVEVYDAVIIGESDIYNDQIRAQNLPTPCLQNMVVGLQLNTDDGRIGAVIHSASFSGFSNTRCDNEFAARLDNRVMSIAGIPDIGDGGTPDEPNDGGGGDGDGAGGTDHSLGDLPGGLFLNCGSTEESALEGSKWTADEYFENGVGILARPSNPSNFNQYREQRGGSLDYTIPVNDGLYSVDLHWAEAEFSANNRRRFNVFLNGRQVLTNFDVHREGGGRNKRVKRTFIVSVENDDELQISLVGTTDQAFVTLLGVQTHRA